MITIALLSAPTQAPAPAPASCNTCRLRQRCLPQGLDDAGTARVEGIVSRRRSLQPGEALYRMGDRFNALYALHLGHFKSVQLSAHGNQRISAFQMAGDLLGLDGLADGRHGFSAIALDAVEVCEIPFPALQDLLPQMPALLLHFVRTLSAEISRERLMAIFPGKMLAEQRFAMFLLELSSRYAALGYSASRFQLRMSRDEIGAYLGLTIESTSRILTRFRDRGLVHVDRRNLTLLDRTGLSALALGCYNPATLPLLATVARKVRIMSRHRPAYVQ